MAKNKWTREQREKAKVLLKELDVKSKKINAKLERMEDELNKELKKANKEMARLCLEYNKKLNAIKNER